VSKCGIGLAHAGACLHAVHATGSKAGYRRCTPQHAVLHQTLSTHFAQFRERADEQAA
jgi:hypothetical protein